MREVQVDKVIRVLECDQDTALACILSLTQNKTRAVNQNVNKVKKMLKQRVKFSRPTTHGKYLKEDKEQVGEQLQINVTTNTSDRIQGITKSKAIGSDSSSNSGISTPATTNSGISTPATTSSTNSLLADQLQIDEMDVLIGDGDTEDDEESSAMFTIFIHG